MLRFFRVVVAVIATILTNFQDVPMLQIVKQEQIIYSTLLPDREFALAFIHSVEMTPVYEYYRIDSDGSLVLYETRYSSYGAGLPSEPGEGFQTENGQFVVKMTRKFGEISLRVSHINGHGILFKDKSIMFKEIASENELITLRARFMRMFKQ